MTKTFDLGIAQMLRLHGPEARSFAHAQFSSDVAALPANDWQWSAWLDAKGRARYFFALIDTGDSLLAWLPLGDAATFAQELRRFLFRSKLTVESVEDWALRGQFDTVPQAPRLQRYGDGFQIHLNGDQPRLVELIPMAAAKTDDEAVQRWRGCDARDRLPLIDGTCAGAFVPQALELPQLGAISFNKGCYPGQEIAARLHFRGGNKRGLRTIRWNDADTGIQPGTEWRQPDNDASVATTLYCGTDAAGLIGLAVVSAPTIAGTLVTGHGTRAMLAPP